MVVVVVVVVVEGLPELGWPEPDRVGAPERCLVFGQPEWPGEPEHVLGTEGPRLGPGVVGASASCSSILVWCCRVGSWGAGKSGLGSG